MTRHFDYLAIGGGSGGIASINRAAMYGQKCALIEAKELGGTCVNVGCVPKKIMWHAAQIAEAIHLYGPDYGFDTTVNRFDWATLVKNRSAYVDRIHNSYDNVLGKNKVEVIKGFARFVDAHSVEVNGEIITANHILIATGGRPVHPSIPGAEYGIDSDGFLSWTRCQNALRSSAQATLRLSWLAWLTRWDRKRICSSVNTRRCAASIRCLPKRWSK